MHTRTAIGIFIVFIISWILRNFFLDYNEFFYWPYAFYYLMALFGGVTGLITAKKWGGWKSAVGRAIIIFSLGLLGQVFGQIYYSIQFEFIGNTEPYPIGEIGFLSSVVLYAIGAFHLVKISGSKIALKSTHAKVLVIAVPIALYSLAYFAFIKGSVIDLSEITFGSITSLLSIIYPLVHATFISLALIAYLLSRNILGGKLAYTIISVLFALLVHYFAESLYLYQVINDKFVAGSTADLAFLIAYFTMTLAIIQFANAYKKISSNK